MISTAFSPDSDRTAVQPVDNNAQWRSRLLVESHQLISTMQQAFSTAAIAQSSLSNIILGVALIGIACASIFVVIAEQTLSPTAIAFNRLLIAAIAFGSWNWFQRFLAPQSSEAKKILSDKPLETPLVWQDIVLFSIAGFSFAASLTGAAWSLTQTTVATSALLNNMMPIFTTLGAWMLLGKQFSLRFVLGLGVAIAGVVAIGIQDLHVDINQMAGDAAALGAAVLLAATILSVEQLRIKFSTSVVMMAVSLIGSVAIAPVLILSGNPLFPTSWTAGLAVLSLALISQVIGHGLLTYSLKQFSSGLVSVSMLTIPVLSAVLAMVLFAQQPTLISSCTFLIVLLGIYISISAAKQP